MTPEALRALITDRAVTGAALAAVLRAGADSLLARAGTSLWGESDDRWESWPSAGLLRMSPGQSGPITHHFQLPLTPAVARHIDAAEVGRWWLRLLRIIDAAGAAGYTCDRPQSNELAFTRPDSPFFSLRHRKLPPPVGAGADLRPLYDAGARELVYASVFAGSTTYAVAAVDADDQVVAVLPGDPARALISRTRTHTVALTPNGLHCEPRVEGATARSLSTTWAAPWTWTVPA